MDKIVVVLTTVPEGAYGDTLARALVDRQLAACVSVLPCHVSTYRWQGTVETTREHQLIVKTSEAKVAALHEAVQALHPYDLPEWLVIRVDDGDPAYLTWVARMGLTG